MIRVEEPEYEHGWIKEKGTPPRPLYMTLDNVPREVQCMVEEDAIKYRLYINALEGN